MPYADRVFRFGHMQRWSRYITDQLSAHGLSRTALATRLGIGTQRVSLWCGEKRGVEPESAWDTGEALRTLGARTSGIEALWAAGYFDDVIRTLQSLALQDEDGPRRAGLLYTALPVAMMPLECRIAASIRHVIPSDMPRDEQLALARHYQETSDPYGFSGSFADERDLDYIAAESERYIRDDGLKYGAFSAKWFTERERTLREAFTSEAYDALAHSWGLVVRGATIRRDANMMVTLGKPEDFYVEIAVYPGDQHLSAALADLVERWRPVLIPTLIGVRVWRLLHEWVDELMPKAVDVERVPDAYLPANMRLSPVPPGMAVMGEQS